MSFYNKVSNMKTYFQGLGSNDKDRTLKMSSRMDDLMESKDGQPAKLQPEDFSVKEIFEAVPPSAFPIITGKLISNKVMQAYNLYPKIGEQLTEVMNSNLEVDRVPGAYQGGNVVAVNPGGPYQHTGYIEEKWVQIGGQKYGKILDITEEAIMFDRTGLILKRANDIGKLAAQYKEKMTIYTVADQAGYKAWYPNESAETSGQNDLYQDAQGAGDPHVYDNVITNALSDISDVEPAMILLGLMKDDNGDPIHVVPRTLLVPVTLFLTAQRIIYASYVKGSNSHEDNPLRNAFNILHSPYLDAISTTQWYLGDFKSQFVWKEVIPLQVLTRMDSKNDAAWERDIKAQFKVRFYGKPAALDYRHVVRSTGAA